MDFLIWLIKVNIATALLYAVYKLFFQQDTFFYLKRFVLLLLLFFSLIYSFFDINEFFSFNKTNLLENSMTVELPEFFVRNTQEAPQTMPFLRVAGIVWILGSILLLLYFIVQIISISSKIFNSKKTRLMGIDVYVLKGLKAPFSFFNFILIDPDLHNEQELSEILHHEETHVREKHTWDVICCELFCVLFWFNPFAWLMKKEIRINLEFLADYFVMKSVKNIEHYQLHLLKLSYHRAVAQISNNFNVSPLKKRIQMMNKKKSSNAGMIKYILFVPLFAALLFVNNLQAQNNEGKVKDEKQEQASQSKVVDVNGREVFTFVEKMPQFPGGEVEMMKYLSQNIKYPAEAQKEGIQGTVICRFVVTSTGDVKDVQILRSLAPSTEEEAIRVVSAMPKWTPGEQGGKAVDVYYTLPIRFSLLNDNVTPKKEDIRKPAENLVVIDGTQKKENPLLIVDGKEVSYETIKNLKPDDIKSIDVLKDKSATNIYGKKGKNGVVVITMKKI